MPHVSFIMHYCLFIRPWRNETQRETWPKALPTLDFAPLSGANIPHNNPGLKKSSAASPWRATWCWPISLYRKDWRRFQFWKVNPVWKYLKLWWFQIASREQILYRIFSFFFYSKFICVEIYNISCSAVTKNYQETWWDCGLFGLSQVIIKHEVNFVYYNQKIIKGLIRPLNHQKK